MPDKIDNNEWYRVRILGQGVSQDLQPVVERRQAFENFMPTNDLWKPCALFGQALPVMMIQVW
jgi:hypothetical protein